MTSPGIQLLDVCRSLFERGLTPGATGNASIRHGANLIITPTGKSLGRLTAADLAVVPLAGPPGGSGPVPSKELGLHLAAYQRGPATSAVVHLHSPWATAVSCLAGIDADAEFRQLTAYHRLKVGRLVTVGYFPPGSPDLVSAVRGAIADADALLLRNHGTLVASGSLERAADAAEQIEQSAQIYLLLGGRPVIPVPEEE